MSATYPTGTVVFPTIADYTSIDTAENVIAAYQEIVAVETALGPNVQLLHDPSHVSGTLGAIVDALDTSKSPVGHTHSSFPTLVVGNTGAANTLFNGNSIQAQNSSSPAILTMQPNGGDVHIGTGGIQLTVYGGITAQGGTVTASTLQATSMSISGAASVGSLTSGGNITCSGLFVSQIECSVVVDSPMFRLTGGGSFNINNGDSIRSSGANLSTWDGDVLHSVKNVVGQFTAAKQRAFGDFTYGQSPIIVERPPGDTRTDISMFNYYGGGTAIMFMLDAQATNLGWQARNGQNTAYAAVTASSFIVGSSRLTKTDIEDFGVDLRKVSKLNPVSFNRDSTGVHAPHETVDGRRQAIAGSRLEVSTAERKWSAGDKKRSSAKHVGLIAEDVVRWFPEVVHYDDKGKPAGIDYNALAVVALGAVQQLVTRVEHLESRLNA